MSGAPVLIARQVERVLRDAVGDLAVPVERQRTEALAQLDLPRVLIHEDGTGAEVEFVGGDAMRFVRFQVEAVADGDTPLAAQDAVAVLRERVREALEADRLLLRTLLLVPMVVGGFVTLTRTQAAGVQALAFSGGPATAEIPLCLGLFVSDSESRADLPAETNARGAALMVTCYYAEQPEAAAGFSLGFAPPSGGGGGSGADVSFVQNGAGAVTRTLQDKARDLINVRDFGAVGNGVADDRAAFLNAIASIPPGGSAPIYVPPGVWNVTGQITTTDRTPVFLVDPGASFVQTNLNFTFQAPIRIERWVGRAKRSQNFQATPDRTMSAMHEYVDLRNTGATAGYGWRWDYSSGAVPSGFDIAHGILSTWDRVAGQTGGQMLGQWLVARSPMVGGADTRWGCFVAEWNIVNRGPDTGWSPRRSPLLTWTGGLQLVAEASTLGVAGSTADCTFAAMIGGSGGNKPSDGLPARFHTGILFEPNGITPVGRAIYASGRNTLIPEAQTPFAFAEIGEWWQRGFSTVPATLTTGIALAMGETHSLAWLDSSYQIVRAIEPFTGNPEGVLTRGRGSIVLRVDGGVGSTLYIKETPTGNMGWRAL